MFLTFCICILELGEGWAPAVINSPEELILMYKIQKKMYDDQSYWISGSTYVEDEELVTFFDYMPNLTG